MKKSDAWLGSTQPFMAVASASFVLLFLVLVLANLDLVGSFQSAAQAFVALHFSSYLVWVVTIIMLFTIAVAVSPYGRIRLGKDDERPEFSRFSWFAMLFSAGVGTGILFYGVAEPMFHLQANPYLARDGVAPLTAEAAIIAQRITLFHWGLHGWAVYSMVGLCLGYFCYRRGLPLSIRSALYPFLGERIYGPAGHTIDLLAVLSTLFGIAVSLGLGASQIASGLQYLFGIEFSPLAKFALILVVSSIATVSAVSGVHRGIRRLSEINILLSMVLIGFLILAGPTVVILLAFANGTADYFSTFLPMGVWVNPDRSDPWQGSWTIFYWGWWIAWAPFVGMFIARVSKGRSVREFVLCVLIIPTLVSVLWMNAFGGTAVFQFINDGYTGVTETVSAWTPELSLFKMLDPFPMSGVLSAIGIVLVIVFFITSSDSGSLVIDSITAGGKVDAPVVQRVFWCTFEGLVAIALLLGGGLASLQAAAIATGFPFAIVLVAMCYSVYVGLRAEHRA